MSEDQRLLEHLLELGEPISDSGPRTLTADNITSITCRLLREIDETILPRQITFETNAGGILSLTASSRRILQFTKAIAIKGTPADDSFLGQPFNDLNSFITRQFAQFLGAFLENCNSLTITTEKSDTPTDPSNVGCSANSIATLWDLDLYPPQKPQPQDLLNTLIVACDAVASAWVIFQETTPMGSKGDADQISRVSSLTPDQLAEFDAKIIRAPGETAQQGFVQFNQNATGGTTLIFARDHNLRAFIYMPSTKVAVAQKAWQSQFS